MIAAGGNLTESKRLRTRPAPTCPVCGGSGALRHTGLSDRIYGAPGEWNVRECEAASCGQLWLDPAPIEADLALAYEHYYTHAELPRRGLRRLNDWLKGGLYSRRFHYPGASRRQRACSLVLQCWPSRFEATEISILGLPFLPDGRVLDVGCGDGGKVRLYQELGWNAEGVDIDGEAVARGRAAGLRLHVGTLESLGLPAESLDAVAMSHVVEHLPNPQETLAECARVLRPRGILALLTPNARALGHRVFGGRWRGLEPPRHLQIFTESSLLASLRASGFETVRVTTPGRLAATIVRESLEPGSAPGAVDPRRARPMLGLAATGFALAERLALWAAARVGEEIFVLARRPAESSPLAR